MIVIDASAVVDVLLRTPNAGAVRRAVGEEREVHAPELLEPECLSAFRRWLSREWIAPHAAHRAVRELDALPLVRHGHRQLGRVVWSLRDRCSPYDAFYIALAVVLDAELVTTDASLARAATGVVRVAAVG